MSVNPLISVIIPVYNGANFISDAIASVRAQAYSPLEIIVVDDGSTDETAQVLARLGADLRYIYQPNQGPAAARNLGLSLAQAELITFLDADDLWGANKLINQAHDLYANPTTEVIWGKTQICTFQEIGVGLPICEPNWSPLLGSLLCHRNVFRSVGAFDPTLRVGEDVDWLIRLQEQKIAVYQSPEIALIYRLRQGSLTCHKTVVEFGLLDAVKRSVKRRRLASVEMAY